MLSSRRFQALSFAAALLLGCDGAQAGMGEWTTSGPPGVSRPFQFVIHPRDSQLLYSATLAGLYQSRNGGTSWRLVNSKPALAVGLDPDSTNRLHFASSDGFYASIDGGVTWSLRGPPIPTDSPCGHPYSVSALVVEAGGNRLYAVAASGPCTGGGGLNRFSKVFVSSDGGVSWTSLLVANNSIGVAIHPRDSSQLFAFPYAQGVLKSTDRGQTWTTVLSRPWVNSFAIGQTDPVAIYVAFGGSGIYRSLNSGQDWSEADSGIPGVSAQVVSRLILAPSTPTLLALSNSTFRTSDGAATWGTADLAGTDPLAFDPQDSNVLYGILGSELRKSRNGGQSWQAISPGLFALSLSAIATSAVGLGPVYAGGSGEVFQSTNQGASWSAGRQGLLDSPVRDLAVETGNSGRLWAATGGGLFFSIDAGATWGRATLPPSAGPSFSAVAIDPRMPQIVYASTEWGIFRTDDSGLSWRALSTPGASIVRIVLDPIDPNTIYVAGSSVFKSVDGGLTWTRAMLPSGANDLAVDPRNALVVYAAGYTGFFKSSDGASTWTSASNGLSGIPRSIVIDPTTPSRLYVATDMGVYRSVNAGDLWQGMSSGLPAAPTRLAIDPTGLVLYAATDRGVFQLELTPDTARKMPARSRPPAHPLAPRR